MILPQHLLKWRIVAILCECKSNREFPQTGRSPRNGENQPANDWIADKATFSGACTNVGFAGICPLVFSKYLTVARSKKGGKRFDLGSAVSRGVHQ